MALEIKRSPVLSGESAERFLKEIEIHETKYTKEEIAKAFEDTKIILENFRKRR